MTGAVIEVVGGCVVLFLFGVRLISSEHFAEHETVELHVGAHDTQQFVGRNLFEHLFVVFLLDTQASQRRQPLRLGQPRHP